MSTRTFYLDDITIWREVPTTTHSRPIGLSVLATDDADPKSSVVVNIAWKDLAPFRNEIQRGLHDDIAGALRERLVEVLKGALKEVQEA